MRRHISSRFFHLVCAFSTTIALTATARASDFSYSAGTLSASASASSPGFGTLSDVAPLVNTTLVGDYTNHAQAVRGLASAQVDVAVSIRLTSIEYTGTGFAARGGTNNDATAGSGFNQYFSVSDATLITLDSTVDSPFFNGFWRVETAAGQLVVLDTWGNHTAAPITLQPGQYHLTAQMIFGPTLEHMTLKLNQVPEPASLGVAALASLFLMRRRRNG